MVLTFVANYDHPTAEKYFHHQIGSILVACFIVCLFISLTCGMSKHGHHADA
jgi:hypothetical protein